MSKPAPNPAAARQWVESQWAAIIDGGESRWAELQVCDVEPAVKIVRCVARPALYVGREKLRFADQTSLARRLARASKGHLLQIQLLEQRPTVRVEEVIELLQSLPPASQVIPWGGTNLTLPDGAAAALAELRTIERDANPAHRR